MGNVVTLNPQSGPCDPNDPNAVPTRSPTPERDAPFGHTLDEMDVGAFWNIRQWMREAIEAKGARQIGAGLGCGQADIDFELEGRKFNVSIRPLKEGGCGGD